MIWKGHLRGYVQGSERVHDFTSGEDLLPADEALCVKNRPCWVSRGLIFGRVTDETFTVGERNIRRCYTVSLVVRDNLDLSVDIDANARIRCTKVNAYDCTKLLG
jgi:hypothetical protein